MTDFAILIAVLTLIFISSLRVEYYTIAIFLRLTRSKDISMRLFSVMFLPGTIVHEFCHMFAAQLLGVRSTGMELMPRIEGDHIVMGEVGIERTDIFRRLLIGGAPFLLGLPLTILLVYSMSVLQLNWWQILLFLYFVFQTANASFSSSKDMEGSVAVTLIIVLIGIALQIAGVPLVKIFSLALETFVNNGQLVSINKLLCIPLGMNIFIWLLSRLILG